MSYLAGIGPGGIPAPVRHFLRSTEGASKSRACVGGLRRIHWASRAEGEPDPGLDR